MPVLSFLALILTVGLSVFLQTSFNSFKNFNAQTNSFNNWQETSLASAKRISAESSKLLFDLKEELNDCLEAYQKLETQNARTNFQCETHYKDFFEDFKKSIKANYSNQLNKTISFGLNPSGKEDVFSSYSYKIYHTDYIPSAFKKNDELYNSSLISDDKITRFLDISDYDYYLDNEKLNIEPKLLETFVNIEGLKIISKQARSFNLIIRYPTDYSSRRYFGADDLPNAIKLEIKFLAKNSENKDEKETLLKQTLLSAGQLRISNDTKMTKPVTPDPPCQVFEGTQCCYNFPAHPSCNPNSNNTNSGGGTSNPQSPSTEVTKQILNFKIFENISGRGILFDQSRPASGSNPIKIINSIQGRYTSVFPDSNNFLRINIGSLETQLKPLSNGPGFVHDDNTSFASVTLESAVPHGHIKIDDKNPEVLNVDILPRGRKKYMLAKKTFIVNGKTIEAGSALVGTVKAGANIKGAQLKDLTSIRAYDKDTGALIAIFNPDDRPSNACANQACMDITQFSINKRDSLGVDIHTAFSSRDLFAGKNYDEANRLFLAIQQDLEVQSNYGVYAAKFDWQKVILDDDLNSQQQTLLTQLFDKYDTSKASGRKALIDELGFSFLRTGDLEIDNHQEKIEKAFYNFVSLKEESFKPQSSISTKDIKYLKNNFLKLRSFYNDYLKGNISKRKLATEFKKINVSEPNTNRTEEDLVAEDPPVKPTPPTHPGKPPTPPVYDVIPHPGAQPTPPAKVSCKKPKSKACAKKKKARKKEMKAFNKALDAYTVKLGDYYLSLSTYNSKLNLYNFFMKNYQDKLNKYNQEMQEYENLIAKYNQDMAEYERKYG